MNDQLAKSERRVLDALNAGMGSIYSSAEKMAEYLRISKRSYRRALFKLTKRGLLARTPYHPERAYPTPLFNDLEGGE